MDVQQKQDRVKQLNNNEEDLNYWLKIKFEIFVKNASLFFLFVLILPIFAFSGTLFFPS